MVEYDGEVTEYINPEITVKRETQDSIEGCLSIPSVWGVVKRPKYIEGTAFDKKGKRFDFYAEDDEARFICHEYDHLDGKLFIDSAVKTYTFGKIVCMNLITLAVVAVIGVSIGYFLFPYVSSLFL